MELFMIKPVNKAEEKTPEVVDMSNRPTSTQNDGTDKDDIQALKPDTMVGDGTPIQKDEEEKPVLVALQGPLSKVYTDVLNKVLSTETYVSQLVVSEAEHAEMAPHKVEKMSDIDSELLNGMSDENSFGRVLNVFCFNDLTDMDDVIKLNDIVTKSKTQDFILAMESCSNDTVLRSLLRMEKNGLIKLSMTRTNAIHALASNVLTKKPGI